MMTDSEMFLRLYQSTLQGYCSRAPDNVPKEFRDKSAFEAAVTAFHNATKFLQENEVARAKE